MVTAEDLKKVELFEGLPVEVMEGLTGRLCSMSFSREENIIYRGDPGYSMFVILDGRVSVNLTNEEGVEYTVGSLGEGEVFGEMALLTGEPRSANVKAESEVRVVEIGQDLFHELIESCPELNSRLFKILAQRLGKSTVQQQANDLESREIIVGLLSSRQAPEVDHFPGNTKWTREINQAIERLAGQEENVLVLGEMGTGKDFFARLVHFKHEDQNRPLLYLDCANPPPVLRETGRKKNGGDNRLDEIAQEAALFGHGPDSAVYSQGTRKGYLELADGGDLILENVEMLAPSVQRKLARYLKDYSFTRKGETAARTSRVRIFATACPEIEDLAVPGGFSPELCRLLSREVVHLRPLRERKKDIPIIADHFRIHFNRTSHKDVKGFTRDAISTLVEYDWPMNVDELRQVIDRAVAICREDKISAEQIFLNVTPFSGKNRINLLKMPWFERIVRGRFSPSTLRYLSVPFFVFAIVFTLLGPRENNLANLMVWAAWWPFLIFSIAISARSWCGYCPLPGINKAARVLKKPLMAMPRGLKKHGVWIGMIGFVAIVYIEHATGMFGNPRATAALLVTILGAAFVTTALFGERIWCKHLCPLGSMISHCSAISVVELGGNNNVCANQCSTHACIRQKSCPMGLHPAAAKNSNDCVLCLSCVKSCSQQSVRIDARAPWMGVTDRNKWEFSEALFAILLVATVIAVKLPSWLGENALAVTYLGSFSITGTGMDGVISFVVVTAVVCVAALMASAVFRGGRWKHDFTIAGYAYLPLAFAGLFNVYFHEFVYHGHELLPLAIRTVRLDQIIMASWITPNLATLKALIPLATLAGSIMSFHVLGKMAANHCLPAWVYRAHQLLLAVATGVFLIII